MNKEQGFTLVELLAVIVILSIILAIAIPSISTLMNNTSRSTFESSAKLVLKGIDYKMLEDSTFDPTNITESNVESELNIDDSNYQTITVKKMNDTLYITIVGKNKWDKLTVSGTKAITQASNTVTNFVGGANAPVLADGMEAVIWSGEDWVGIEESDPDWYNYDTTNKQWANARTEDGSLWVWIPRYVYKITSNWHAFGLPTGSAGTIDIQFSKGIDDNWNKAIIGTIDLREGAEASDAATNGNKYTNQPAFTFGDTELTGIWVGKFEASGTADTIAFIPNVAAFKNVSIGDVFTATRNMETNNRYGWDGTGKGIDTHLMKNTEWGAVAYLAQSPYGFNGRIWSNNSSTYITGCTGISVAAASYAGCEHSYETANGINSSTTGNIYGIYDTVDTVSVSGEFVAIYTNNGNANLTTYGSSIVNADSKYKTIYQTASTDTTTNNFALTINSKGDALYETGNFVPPVPREWYNGTGMVPSVVNVWCSRGISAVAPYPRSNYASSCSNGSAGKNGFRSTLLVSQGL